MQDEQRNLTEQFDLVRFVSNSLRFLRRTFWMVLVAGVLGALVMGFYTRKTYSPVYESHAVLSVRVDNSTVTDVIGSGEKTNSAYTKQLVATFPNIIQSDSMLDRIKRELGTTWINGSITPKVIADSSLFTLTVRSSNPEDAYKILNAVLKCYPDMAFVYIGAASITIIEAPVLPTAPVKALNVTRSAVIGGLVGALLMLAILCLLAQLQTVVTSSSDLKKFTNVPCIVHVPQAELKRRSRSTNQLSLQNEHLPPVYVESIRVLGARVLRFCREQSLKRIVVTSTVPGEGKSTIAANLAMSLGRSGMRVVLIDADLRTQELREFFGVQDEPVGLKELLQDQSLDVLSALTPVPDTNVLLMCGGRVDRPVSLLRHSRLSALLDRLDTVADLVLIDTPPIGLLTDAAAFAQLCDGAIYVVRSGVTGGARIADGMQAVSDCRTQLLGYVLNGVSAKTGSHGYGYRYSYGYGYGSRYGSGYGSSYGRSYGSSYHHYGSYGSYGSYGGYNSYGGYGTDSEVSASDAQKKAESTRKQRKAAEPAAQSRRRTEAATDTPKRLSEQKQETPAQAPKQEPRRETPAQTPRQEPRREAPAQAPKQEPRREAPKQEPRREAPVQTPKQETRRETPVQTPRQEPVRETPVSRPMEAAKAAPIPRTQDAAYDDPELEAIVREVLETTTEEDVRRAYATLEAENARRSGQSRTGAGEQPQADHKKGGLFHRSRDKSK